MSNPLLVSWHLYSNQPQMTQTVNRCMHNQSYVGYVMWYWVIVMTIENDNQSSAVCVDMVESRGLLGVL